MIFLTQHVRYRLMDTPRIEADTWEEAERKCPHDLIVIGALFEEGNIETSIDNLN